MSIEQSAATKTSFGSPIAELSPRDRKTAITGYELRHQIEALVAGIAAKKIRHVYSGTGAWTSPDVMCLPTLPQLLMFRQNEVHILLGYGAHEICHQLESDFEIIKNLSHPATSINELAECSLAAVANEGCFGIMNRLGTQ
mgnify:CR=1 FL=1